MGPVALPSNERRLDVVAIGRQISGLLALLFGSVAGFELGRHITFWMAARAGGGVIPQDAAALALPLTIAALAAAAASRSQSVRALTAVVLILFATAGMVTERLASRVTTPAALGDDAGS